MMEETEARRAAPRKSAPPGLGLTLAMAVISGVVSWFWLTAGQAKPAAPDSSALTEVEATDIPGALTTINLPNAALDQFRAAKDGECRRPLAWVSLASPPGAPPSHIRLISGTYYSPVFEVSATPVRVAIPYPAPYETGQGALTAIEVGGSASIALLPAWHVSAADGRVTRPVTWKPVQNCVPRNG